MSYILDALKKSDQERKQGDVPNLQTVHVAVAQEQHRPWVLYGVVLFLLMALAFAIGVLLSTSPGSEGNVGALLIEKNHEKVDAAEKSSAIVLSSRESGAVSTTTDQQIKEAAVPSVQVVEPSVNRQAEKTPRVTVDEKTIPYLTELADYQQQLIPEMSFAGHVYSSDAASRSVIINDRAMSEGDELMRGMSVEKITRSGVVIRFNDILFRVDVLQNWSFE